MISKKWKTTITLVLSSICVMLLMGQSCVEREKAVAEKYGDPYNSFRDERGTVRVLEEIRKEMVLFREKCSCDCSTKEERL